MLEQPDDNHSSLKIFALPAFTLSHTPSPSLFSSPLALSFSTLTFSHSLSFYSQDPCCCQSIFLLPDASRQQDVRERSTKLTDSWVIMQVIKIQFVVCIQFFAIFIVGTESQCPSQCHCHGDLQHVICDNVGLKKIPHITEATRLVNLQRNNLGILPSGGFREMKGLVSLHLQHCKIHEISTQAFKGLKKLIYLYLSNNEISTIKTGAFEDLTELTYLYMDGNQISSLSKGIFSPMINLFILQLDNNKIRDLQTGTFAGAKDLRWLHISNNELRSMQPGSLDEVENLATLTLDHNKLSTYPIEAMSKLRVVEELNLSNNPLTFIPDYAFRSFGRYIEKLHLNDMGLEKVSCSVMQEVHYISRMMLDKM